MRGREGGREGESREGREGEGRGGRERVGREEGRGGRKGEEGGREGERSKERKRGGREGRKGERRKSREGGREGDGREYAKLVCRRVCTTRVTPESINTWVIGLASWTPPHLCCLLTQAVFPSRKER